MATEAADRELRDAFALIAKARAYWDANAARLMSEYQNQWIAIGGDGVVVADRNPERLLDLLQERGLDERRVMLRFVYGPEVEFAF